MEQLPPNPLQEPVPPPLQVIPPSAPPTAARRRWFPELGVPFLSGALVHIVLGYFSQTILPFGTDLSLYLFLYIVVYPLVLLNLVSGVDLIEIRGSFVGFPGPKGLGGILASFVLFLVIWVPVVIGVRALWRRRAHIPVWVRVLALIVILLVFAWVGIVFFGGSMPGQLCFLELAGERRDFCYEQWVSDGNGTLHDCARVADPTERADCAAAFQARSCRTMNADGSADFDDACVAAVWEQNGNMQLCRFMRADSDGYLRTCQAYYDKAPDYPALPSSIIGSTYVDQFGWALTVPDDWQLRLQYRTAGKSTLLEAWSAGVDRAGPSDAEFVEQLGVKQGDLDTMLTSTLEGHSTVPTEVTFHSVKKGDPVACAYRTETVRSCFGRFHSGNTTHLLIFQTFSMSDADFATLLDGLELTP